MVAHPVRSCVACRRRAPKSELVRLVVTGARAPGEPGHGGSRDSGSALPTADATVVVVDPGARRPGRGAYVCPQGPCIEQALRGGGVRVARALRTTAAGVDEDEVRRGWQLAVGGDEADTAAGGRQGVVA